MGALKMLKEIRDRRRWARKEVNKLKTTKVIPTPKSWSTEAK